MDGRALKRRALFGYRPPPAGSPGRYPPGQMPEIAERIVAPEGASLAEKPAPVTCGPASIRAVGA